MQKIRSFLKISNGGVTLCDNFGSDVGVNIELMLGTGALMEFELHGEPVGESAVLPDYPLENLDFAAGYCAFDLKCTNSDDPPLLIVNGITLSRDSDGRTIFTVPVANNATDRIVEALGKESEIQLLCELGGFDRDGMPLFAWQFPVTLRNRVYRGNGNESIVDDPTYFTAVQVQAIAAALEKKIEELSNTSSNEEKVTAGTLTIVDNGNWFAGEDVEAVLQEIGSQLDGAGKILETI